MADGFKGIQLRFHPNETAFPACEDAGPGSIFLSREKPCYRCSGPITHNQQKYTYVMYRWYYKYNLGIGCCHMIPESVAMGYHAGDYEGVTVLLDWHTQKPAMVYFHAHSHGQGTWRLWKDCEKTEDGCLVVYVALFSHASYPSPRRYIRGFGFATDVTSKKGRHINYTEYSHVDYTTSVFPRVPLPARSIRAWEMFALPWFVKKLRQL